MLIQCDNATLLVVDIQEKLLFAVQDPQTLVANTRKLLGAAVDVGLPIVFSEQYPQGIGETLPVLKAIAPDAPIIQKMHFSCAAEDVIPAREQIILCGIEAHVCVLQTALELKALGKTVFVVTDCISSRTHHDKEIALRRFEQAGIHLVTREMVLFETLRVAGTPLFKQLSQTYLIERSSTPPPLNLKGLHFAEILEKITENADLPETLTFAEMGHAHNRVTLENRPGQAGSLKVYWYLFNQYQGIIAVEAALFGLKLYAEHTTDALLNPGKHPNIDRLFEIAAGKRKKLKRSNLIKRLSEEK